MANVYVNGNLVTPASQKEGELFSRDAKADNPYILIQSAAPLTLAQQQELKSQGPVWILDRLSNSTYLCLYTGKDLESVRKRTGINYANVYHKTLRVESGLKKKITSAGPDTPLAIAVTLHPHPDVLKTSVLQDTAKALGITVDALERDGAWEIRGTGTPRQIDQLANINQIRTVRENPEVVPFNNLARAVLQVPPAPPVPQNPSGGIGQQIIVADTGLDYNHPAVKDRFDDIVGMGGGGRMSFQDVEGHGTHVAATALGVAASDSPDAGLNGPIIGTAPASTLLALSLTNPAGKLGVQSWERLYLYAYPQTLKRPAMLNKKPANYPGRIMNLSFGASDITNSYGKGEMIDRMCTRPIIYDYSLLDGTTREIPVPLAQEGETLYVVAAGNYGAHFPSRDGQICEEASAKNCLTVGACDSPRPGSGLMYRSAGPARSANNILFMSNRGLCPAVAGAAGEPRIKPDVVAPGTAILSAKSSQMDEYKAALTTARYGTSGDAKWQFRTGTSMAAPLVSGCAAVIRATIQARQHGFLPPAALLKAIIVNGTDDLSQLAPAGVYYTPTAATPATIDPPADPNEKDPKLIAQRQLSQDAHLAAQQAVIATLAQHAIPRAPNTAQGFGRVNLAASLRTVNAGTYTIAQLAVTPGAPGIPHRHTIDIPAGPAKTLKVTLAYSDAPGASLQNVFTLKVTPAAGGNFVHGNRHPGAADAQTPDLVNNVQKVVWPAIPAGTATVEVKFESAVITEQMMDMQGFALAWSVE